MCRKVWGFESLRGHHESYDFVPNPLEIKNLEAQATTKNYTELHSFTPALHENYTQKRLLKQLV